MAGEHDMNKDIWGYCCSAAKSCPTLCDPHGLQHARLPCPPLSPGVCSNSRPLSQWWYPTISSSVVPFSSCLQSFPASGSFPISQFFASGGQSIGASASILPMYIQDWFPLGLTGVISLQSKGLSEVFCIVEYMLRKARPQAVHWLGLSASTAGGYGLIPGWGTKKKSQALASSSRGLWEPCGHSLGHGSVCGFG